MPSASPMGTYASRSPEERGLLASRPVARRPSSAGLTSEDQSDARLPPKSAGARDVANRGVWQYGALGGRLRPGSPEGRGRGRLLNLNRKHCTFYNIIACFIDIHSKAVYNTIVRHIFGEIWYVVKKMR